jgi:hypothetical protein
VVAQDTRDRAHSKADGRADFAQRDLVPVLVIVVLIHGADTLAATSSDGYHIFGSAAKYYLPAI